MDLNFLSLIYLASLPFIIFSSLSSLHLLLSLLLGSLLYNLFQKSSFGIFILFIITVLSIFIVSKPKLGLDMGLLNSINSQRGEHQNFETNSYAKIIHNKSEWAHSFVANLDKIVTPKAIFAAGFWPKISPYYPLGYLFPWDIYFLYRYLFNIKNNYKQNNWIFFVFSFAATLIFTGLIYIDQALTFALGVTFFVALLVSQGYSSCSKRTQYSFLVLNIFYLFYQLLVTNFFKA